MKYGYIRGEAGRRDLSVILAVPSSNSLKTMIKNPVQLIEQTDKERVQSEIIWTRARINLVIF